MMKGFIRASLMLVALLIHVGIPAAPAFAQSGGATDEYVVGPEDVIAVNVWLHPELDRTVEILADGRITFPPIGKIEAAGLTTNELGERIADRLSSYLRQTATVTVTVSQYLYRSVYVIGAVVSPGRYGFETIPGILDVLNRAGGAVPGANLSNVQIQRPEGTSRRIINVDITSALQIGGAAPLPDLLPGDTIVIPGAATGELPAGSGVGVLGAVGRPGVYPVGEGQELWAVLSAAGGVTATSNLAQVRIIRTANETQSILTLNLRETLTAGSAAPYIVQNGDVVFVEQATRGFWGTIGAGGAALFGVGLIVLASVLTNNRN
jgi:polysaccharide export outer membrane protein